MALSAPQRATLRALLDRLIPADEAPGALDAGVETYLLRQLAGDCADEAAGLAAGLDQLEAEAAALRANATFVTLAPETQDTLIATLENGRPATAWPASALPAQAFINRLIDLAHEGFYADPGNGGNRDRAAWRMIGYDPRLPDAP